MSLEIKNTQALTDPTNLKLKILIYGLSGVGKTQWATSAPNPGVAACETGHGAGLLTAASRGIDYVTPTSLTEFEAFCSGSVFKDKETVILDSLTDAYKTFIKDYALSIPRRQGDSDKRRKGVPELDDYGVMGEICRRLLRKLIDSHPSQHVIVTATEKYSGADPENGQAETLIGPDLPGQMFLGSTAMFDLVLRLRTRQALKNPADPKSRFIERYLVCQHDGRGTIAKSRLNTMQGSILDKEEVGDFNDIFGKIVNKLKEVPIEPK